MAEKAALSKKDSEAAVNAVLETITSALSQGDEIRLVGFGTFEVKKRSARIGRTPQTRTELRIPASKIPSFTAGNARTAADAK